jgi:hypothetical protein
MLRMLGEDPHGKRSNALVHPDQKPTASIFNLSPWEYLMGTRPTWVQTQPSGKSPARRTGERRPARRAQWSPIRQTPHRLRNLPMGNQPFVAGRAHQIGLAVLTTRSERPPRMGSCHGWSAQQARTDSRKAIRRFWSISAAARHWRAGKTRQRVSQGECGLCG